MSARAEQRIGEVIDRYRIEALLGEGGFGAVYRAKHVVMGRDVALKLLHPGTERDDDMRERFLREAQAAAAVGHRSIVQVFDCGITTDGTAFIAMELLKGEDLEEHLKKHGSVSSERAIQIVVDLLDGLEAAHHAGIVHRDLKPANVFLTGDSGEEIKILDFGISQMRGEGIKNLTQTGMVMGTPHYMAPETFRGVAKVDARADLYAVGAMLYQLLAGHPPHDAQSYEQLVVRVATQPAPPIQQAVPSIPLELARIVDHALVANPEERWPDARRFREALLPFSPKTNAPQGGITTQDAAAPAMTPAWGVSPGSPASPVALQDAPETGEPTRPSKRPPDPLAVTGFAAQAQTPAAQVLAPSAHPPAHPAPSRSKVPILVAAVVGMCFVAGIAAFFAMGREESASADASVVEPATNAPVPIPPGPATPSEQERAAIEPDKPAEAIIPEAAPAEAPGAPPPPSLAPPTPQPAQPAPQVPTPAPITSVRVDLQSALGMPRSAALRFGDGAGRRVMPCARSAPHIVRVMMMVGPGGEIGIAQPDPNEDHGDDNVARCVAERMGQDPMVGAEHGIAVYRVELPAR